MSQYVGKPFTAWTLEDATSAVADAVTRSLGDDGERTDLVDTATDSYARNRAYCELHDHWQDGDAWVGPDGGEDSAIRDEILRGVKRQFTPVDVIGEALERVADALLKTEADIDFAAVEPAGEVDENGVKQASAEQEQQSAQMVAAVSQWWDSVKLWAKTRTAVKRSRWSGRGLLRVWVAPGDRNDDGTLPTGLTLPEALARLQLAAPESNTATVYTDARTQKTAAIILTKDEDGNDRAELWFRADGDGEAVTVRVLGTDDTAVATLPLSARLPLAEMEADVLITEPIRRQQNRVNFAESLFNRVLEVAGFPERYLVNAMPPVTWSETEPTTEPAVMTTTLDDGRTLYAYRTTYTLGAAVVTELQGIPLKDKDGNETRTSPSVIFNAPTDPEYVARAARHARATMLRSLHQAHVLSEEDLQGSGISRRVARSDHENDVGNTKGPAEGMLRDILEAAVAYAGAMSPEAANFLTAFRCVVNLRVDTGPIDATEADENIKQVEAGLMAEETAMARNGIEDVDAEKQRIQSSPFYQAKLAKARGDAMTALGSIGDGAGAAGVAGIPEDDIAKLFPVQQTDNGNGAANGNGSRIQVPTQ